MTVSSNQYFQIFSEQCTLRICADSNDHIVDLSVSNDLAYPMYRPNSENCHIASLESLPIEDSYQVLYPKIQSLPSHHSVALLSVPHIVILT